MTFEQWWDKHGIDNIVCKEWAQRGFDGGVDMMAGGPKRPVAFVNSIRNGTGTINILMRDVLNPGDHLYTHPANDELRKAAEEILAHMDKDYTVFSSHDLAKNLRAALKK